MKQRYDHFIHGAWTPPANGQYVERISPATEEPLTTIARGSARDIDIAVQDAHRAYPAWRALAPGRRAELMRAGANGIRAEPEALALLHAQEPGKTGRASSRDRVCQSVSISVLAGTPTHPPTPPPPPPPP